MKKQVIIVGLLALAGITNGQPFTGPVGINNTTPSFALDLKTGTSNDGININQPYSGSAWLVLKNSNNASGKRWGLESGGGGSAIQAGNFAITDITSAPANTRFFINGSTGNIGIGTTSPGDKLEVITAATNGRAICGRSTNAGAAFGTHGEAIGTSYASAEAVGIFGVAWGNQTNYGGKFFGDAVSGCSGNTYGIYADVINACGGNIDWAGYFVGNTNMNGDLHVSGTIYNPSDKKLKKDINPLSNGLDKIRLLNPSTYLFKTEEFTGMNLPKEKQIGLIAQELETVFPELVTTLPAIPQRDRNGKVTHVIPEHKTVNYIGLIPVLISAVQNQDKTIISQQQQIDELKQQLTESIKQNNTTGINNINGETGFVMGQNEPNPFSHETVIKYTLPQQVNTASLIVYDLTGKQITSFALDQKGASSITITAEKLAAGIYIYSIVADGRIMDSKRMIVSGK